MKARTLTLLAGIGASLLVGDGAGAAFIGITVETKSGTTAGTGGNPAGVDVFVCNVYANFDNPNDQLIAVAGIPDTPMLIEVVGGTFFQAVGMGAGDIAPGTAAIASNPDVALDSFITIDAKLIGSPVNGGEFATDGSQTVPGWPGFNANTLGPSATDPDGVNIAWFVNQLDAPQGLADTGQHTPNGVAGGVLIGQFATSDGSGIQGTFLVHYLADGGGEAMGSFSHFIPAPGTLALLGMGLLGPRRRRRKEVEQ